MKLQPKIGSASRQGSAQSHFRGAGERTSAPGYSKEEWRILVSQIQAGEETAREQLYTLLDRGMRYYLRRQLGPEELDDKLHDTFLIVVRAVRRDELREPERLMGFVRTIVRYQVAAYTKQAVHRRREQTDLETRLVVPDPKQNPEQEAMIRQEAELMRSALAALPKKDREILVRFYLKEQPEEQICREMNLTKMRFRFLKFRAKDKFGEIGKKKIKVPKILLRFKPMD
jgi:RNA polymerase sigma-70 factor (ECF subfamily)